MTGSVGELAYLSLGSNLGDREANLRDAIAQLKEAGSVLALSAMYETQPVDLPNQPWFLNCAVELDTEKTPDELMTAILEVEQQMGRKRTQKKARALSTSTFCCLGTRPSKPKA